MGSAKVCPIGGSTPSGCDCIASRRRGPDWLLHGLWEFWYARRCHIRCLLADAGWRVIASEPVRLQQFRQALACDYRPRVLAQHVADLIVPRPPARLRCRARLGPCAAGRGHGSGRPALLEGHLRPSCPFSRLTPRLVCPREESPDPKTDYLIHCGAFGVMAQLAEAVGCGAWSAAGEQCNDANPSALHLEPAIRSV
jgi:hypothetical protein